jgi:Flp pilus assembly protein TadG
VALPPAELLPRRGERGAAAVEFGLVAVLLVTMLVGIIQFSLWFWSFQVAEHAAREGARRYAVDPCNSSANDALVRSRVGSATSGAVSISSAFSAGNPPEAGDDVTVTVSFPPHQIGGGLIPTPDVITQRATSRVEDVEDC